MRIVEIVLRVMADEWRDHGLDSRLVEAENGQITCLRAFHPDAKVYVLPLNASFLVQVAYEDERKPQHRYFDIRDPTSIDTISQIGHDPHAIEH